MYKKVPNFFQAFKIEKRVLVKILLNLFLGILVKELAIIDTFGFFFRAYYALPPLSAPDGTPTGLLTGFINFLQKFQKEHSFDYLIFALDSAGESFREEFFKEYKANRQKAPDDLLIQLQIAIKWIEKMGFGAISVGGFEADDIIASIVKRVKEEVKITIVSSDKDLYQLIEDKKVVIYDWVKKSIIDEDKCREKFGVNPKNFVDFQALVGDSSDNVPGVKGIGIKSASKLINEWENLENIYQNLEKIKPPRVQKLLKEAKEEAFLSKKLVKLEDEIFESINLEAFRVEDKNYLENLKSDFERLGMKQALKYASQSSSEKVQEIKNEFKFEVEILDTKEKLLDIIEKIPKDLVVAFDTETNSLDTKSAKIVGFSFAFEEKRGYYVPIAHNYLGVYTQVSLEDAKQALSKLLKRKIVGQNLKFDLGLVYNLFEFPRISFEADTMILGWLLDSGSKVGLDFLALRYLNYQMKSYSDIVKKGEDFSSVDIQTAAFYAVEDAIITLKLYNKFLEIFHEKSLDKLLKEAYEVEFPFVNVLIAIEQAGIKVNLEYLIHLEKEFSKKLEELTKEIFSLTGENFNINSPKQLGKILFEKLKLKGAKKTKSGFSTNEATLKKIKDTHPVVKKILEYREIQKLLSTYIKPLIKFANLNRSNRIYSTFLQTGTITGRLASKDPNLQNIPVKTSLGRKIRKAFIAKEGFKLLSIDYSQIELRLLAHFSQDKTLLEAFEKDEDIHLATAIKLFGKEKAKEKRDFAKSINFGLLYGMGPKKLSNELNISISEAKEIIQNYFEAFPTIKEYIQEVQNSVIESGFVETLLGRRRYFDYYNASERIRAGILRESVNTLFQGSAADLIKLAMLRIDEVLFGKENAKMLLQIHDELIFEVKEEIALELGKKLQNIMENIYPLRVKLKCTIAIGNNWEELKS